MPKLCPSRNAPEADKVYTPDALAKAIVLHFKPTGKMLEPCKGGGAFLRAMPTADWCELDAGRDYLQHHGQYDWVITNPPWSKIREFLTHAFSQQATNVVFLISINAVMTKARLRLLKQYGYSIKEICCVDTPKEFPATGFQLAAVHFKQGRYATRFTSL